MPSDVADSAETGKDVNSVTENTEAALLGLVNGQKIDWNGRDDRLHRMSILTVTIEMPSTTT